MLKAAIRFAKYIGWFVLAYIALGICMAIYSVVWMAPRADKAQSQFEETVKAGTPLEEIQRVATALNADRISINELPKSEDGATKQVTVSFHRFPGGLSRRTCSIALVGDHAKSIKCFYTG